MDNTVSQIMAKLNQGAKAVTPVVQSAANQAWQAARDFGKRAVNYAAYQWKNNPNKIKVEWPITSVGSAPAPTTPAPTTTIIPTASATSTPRPTATIRPTLFPTATAARARQVTTPAGPLVPYIT